MKLSFQKISLGLLLLFSLASSFAAEPYPNRPIRIIVPFAAGGGGDFLVRAWSEKFSEALKQPVIIENRGGGNTTVGTEAVARATPDGYTLLFVSTSLSTNPTLMASLPYKTPDDFTPISMVLSYPFGLAARSTLPANTIGELVEFAKKNPGKVTIANSGDGSASHLSALMLEDMTGTDMTTIAYRGAGPAITDVAAGHVDLTFTGMSQIKPFLDNKRVKLIASSGSKRLQSNPDLKTISEQGIKDYNSFVWWGLLAPAGTPKDVVDKIYQALKVSIASPEVVKKINSIDGEVRLSSPQEFDQFLRDEIARWKKLLTKKKVSGTS
ncbi:tripartite tricarboxylate transporter substrate binding protein [Polynucleobacter sp. MWH-Aus1W21]|uniref:Bug family tripartite tricarboxylate transporter substrate binding protein n=1 Tax=Polynucleobacter sp. MWH-Aus1W21 TaxID=1855880 RepID=UPI001BFE11CB|nr:tripartite tricarboxylate transporter substrate binding protein [Polynucleobacter sp. MWH-Aus1W21]QWD66715.1 tripartite tricarboxylate transporter substrate binding protein [Polynucleobacter sp. MWH-Aus1W21]